MIRRMINTYRVKRIRKMFHLFGEKSYIQRPVKIIGGEYISIGSGFYAGKDCRFEAWDKYNDKIYTPNITIGDDVRINGKCHIGGINSICIGNNVLMGSGVFITDHSHGCISYEETNISPSARDLFSKGKVIIEDNVWLGENVIVLPGVTIGYGAIVGAASVVTKDVPAKTVVAGNPAHVVKRLSK